MKKATKVSGIISIGLALTVALAGCSSAPMQDTYVPPGVDLGDTVVAPPAELPAAVDQVASETDTPQAIDCPTPEALGAGSIKLLNNPPTNVARDTASINGEAVVAAVEIPIQSAYQKKFSYLSKVQLTSGKTVWFGSSGSLNNQEILNGVKLDKSGDSAVFGATDETYNDFVWGSNAGPGSALVQESTKVVELYSQCF
jgi:hypothetical protein